mmetsp:Transcript_4751/g.9611  ORF Transcript_4751/g.9611 Transcript_4751/m.9611 type:complete len:86 (-) Transcript_4751:396-653(-)
MTRRNSVSTESLTVHILTFLWFVVNTEPYNACTSDESEKGGIVFIHSISNSIAKIRERKYTGSHASAYPAFRRPMHPCKWLIRAW